METRLNAYKASPDAIAAMNVAGTGAPSQDYEQGRTHFTEKDFVDLMLLVGAINVWNPLP